MRIVSQGVMFVHEKAPHQCDLAGALIDKTEGIADVPKPNRVTLP